MTVTNIHEIAQSTRAILWSNADGYAIALGTTRAGFDSVAGKARVEVHAYVPTRPINTSKHHPATFLPLPSGEPMTLAATFDVLVPGAKLTGPQYVNHEPVVFQLSDAFDAARDIADRIFRAHDKFRRLCAAPDVPATDDEPDESTSSVDRARDAAARLNIERCAASE